MGQHKTNKTAQLAKEGLIQEIYDMKVETWQGHTIRFVEIDGEWWAILKDVCDSLDLRTDKVAQRLDSSMLKRVSISDNLSKVIRSRGENVSRRMLIVNEMGIYEALFTSRCLEARKFRQWSFGVLKKLRHDVGLEGFEVMRMTEPTIQEEIDYLLDTLYWDEEAGKIMQSVTVQGGDVEQVPYEE